LPLDRNPLDEVVDPGIDAGRQYLTLIARAALIYSHAHLPSIERGRCHPLNHPLDLAFVGRPTCLDQLADELVGGMLAERGAQPRTAKYDASG
jgi:hypothetical protein